MNVRTPSPEIYRRVLDNFDLLAEAPGGWGPSTSLRTGQSPCMRLIFKTGTNRLANGKLRVYAQFLGTKWLPIQSDQPKRPFSNQKPLN
jgi:hypothetical protein